MDTRAVWERFGAGAQSVWQSAPAGALRGAPPAEPPFAPRQSRFLRYLERARTAADARGLATGALEPVQLERVDVSFGAGVDGGDASPPRNAVPMSVSEGGARLRRSGDGHSPYPERKPRALSSAEKLVGRDGDAATRGAACDTGEELEHVELGPSTVLLERPEEAADSVTGDGGGWLHHVVEAMRGWLWYEQHVADEGSEEHGDNPPGAAPVPSAEGADGEAAPVADDDGDTPSDGSSSSEGSSSSRFWREWDVMLSSVEQLSAQHARDRADALQHEIAALRAQGDQFRVRPYFREAAEQIMARLTEAERARLRQYELPPFIRSKLVREASNACKGALQATGPAVLAGDGGAMNAWLERFEDDPYSKSVLDSMSSLSFMASHGAQTGGLRPRVLGDVLWSMWSACIHAMRDAKGGELSGAEGEAVARVIAQHAGELLCRLWLETGEKSEGGLARAGQAVDEIERREAERRAELDRIKREGADARWGVVLSRAPPPAVTRQSMAEVRERLERTLWFRVKTE